jgi:hypothetical protein
MTKKLDSHTLKIQLKLNKLLPPYLQDPDFIAAMESELRRRKKPALRLVGGSKSTNDRR